MSWAQILVCFAVVWWLVLFMVLPFGVRPEEQPQPGNVESAPAQPRLLIKFAITTAIALALTAAFYYVAISGLISFRPAAS
jgi:predicted secreted protein